jgi:hypothetical protein
MGFCRLIGVGSIAGKLTPTGFVMFDGAVSNADPVGASLLAKGLHIRSIPD